MPAKNLSPFWKNQHVIVTGGAGFLGSFVVEQLQALGCPDITVPRSRDIDLRQAPVIEALLQKTKPTMIIHLAAVCGGIGANQAEPGRFFYDNAIMGIQLMEQARRYAVQKYVQVGTVCAYPKFTPVPFKETDLWNGYPEETNAPYGLAKKMLLVQAQAYRQQYGFNAIYLLPANLYGPRDNFDLQTSHVIPALIRKCLEAVQNKQDVLEVWGSGKPSREFLYVEDAAEAILLAAERYNGADPVNIGVGQEVTIQELVNTVASLAGYKGKIVWNTRKPDGQPRRMLDTSQAHKAFGFQARTSLQDGLKKTIDWYLAASGK
ncbi:MAG: GDP-L-fucose synthase [Elusimicrobiota bacterium]|jgi:GDP-L-fucose synthase